MYKKSKKSRKREKETDNFSYSKNKTYKNFFNPHLIFSFLLSYSLSIPRSYSLPPILVFFVCLFVCLFVCSFSDQISNFDLSAMHPFIYLRDVPFIFSLVCATVCWLCFALNKSFSSL
jgi:hypothetical protein